MARTLSTLTLVTKMVIEAQPWRLDPRCLPIPWREEQYQDVQSRPLVVGLLLDDGVVKVHPPIERALKEMEEKLVAAGHEVVHWDPSGHRDLIDIMVSCPFKPHEFHRVFIWNRICTTQQMAAKTFGEMLKREGNHSYLMSNRLSIVEKPYLCTNIGS